MTTAENLLLVHVMTKSKSNASLFFPSMMAFFSILPLIFQDTLYLRYYAICMSTYDLSLMPLTLFMLHSFPGNRA